MARNKVLIVEEDGIRELIRDFLENSGVTDEILEADNGEDSIALVQEHVNSLRLVYMDGYMRTGMHGSEAAKRIKAIDSNMPIVGTGEFDEEGAAYLDGRLQKPFRDTDVLQAYTKHALPQ